MRVSPMWPSFTSATATTQKLCDVADMWTPTMLDQRACYNADIFQNIGLDWRKF